MISSTDLLATRSLRTYIPTTSHGGGSINLSSMAFPYQSIGETKLLDKMYDIRSIVWKIYTTLMEMYWQQCET